MHVCIPSGYLLGNLIPALQLRPDKVVVLTTPKMRDAALRFEALCTHHGIACETPPFPESGFRDQLAAAAALAEHWKPWAATGNTVRINVTGGTKTMTLALAVGTSELKTRSFYCNTENGVLEDIDTHANAAVVSIEDVVDLETFLAAQRLVIVGETRTESLANQKRRDDRAELTIKLVNAAAYNPILIKELNWWCNYPECGPTGLGARLSGATVLVDLMQGLAAAGLAEQSSTTGCWRLLTHADEYLHQSGWLEEFCELMAISAGLTKTMCGVKVKETRGGDIQRMPAYPDDKDYEFDVLGMWKNRMLFIECKAKTLLTEDLRQCDSGARKAVGLFGQKLFVCTGAVGPVARERAKNLDFRVIGGHEVLTLEKTIKTWMG